MHADLWVEIDSSALEHNFRSVKSILPGDCSLAAVVKANAYGHGLVEASRVFAGCGADMLCVTRISEGVTLREAGIDKQVLLFSPTHIDNVEYAIANNLDMTVTCPDECKHIQEEADKLQTKGRIHIKVDTGMGRLGAWPDRALEIANTCRNYPDVEVAGIYTHFASSMQEDLDYCKTQLSTFTELLSRLQKKNIPYGKAHAANSSATLRLEESRLDMVRTGTLLFGQYPSQHVPHSLDLKNTWRLISRISQVRDIPAGKKIGYGLEYTAKRDIRTAVIPVGWSDGFTLVPEGPLMRKSLVQTLAKRLFSKGPSVKINNETAPVVGRVSMQMIVVDVTKFPGVSEGDRAEIPAMRVPTSHSVPRIVCSSF